MERLEASRLRDIPTTITRMGLGRQSLSTRLAEYLGKLEDIVAAVHGGGPAPVSAEVFQWGLSQALWQEATRAELVEHIDRHCPKRRQGRLPVSTWHRRDQPGDQPT